MIQGHLYKISTKENEIQVAHLTNQNNALPTARCVQAVEKLTTLNKCTEPQLEM